MTVVINRHGNPDISIVNKCGKVQKIVSKKIVLVYNLQYIILEVLL